MPPPADEPFPRYGFGSLPVCGKCGRRYDAWIARSTFVKVCLFWLPLKRFMCNTCNKSRHLLKRNPFSG